jgi:hypothetical protein
MGWFSRWRERERELAEGVDSDLIQANLKKRNLGLQLFLASFLLIAVQAKVKLPSVASKIAVALTIACFIGGSILLRWASAENAFLHRPNRPEPPSLWSFRQRR